MKQKIRLYTLQEMISLLRFSIGERLILSVPIGLRKTHSLIESFHSKGVGIQKQKENLVLEYSVNQKMFKFLVEKNSSDALVFEQIIMREEYQGILQVFKNYKIDCENMIDAGANIGLTSIYFKAFFPNANILALEPSSGTFEKLKKNLTINDLSDVIPLKTGLWGHHTFLKPDHSFRGGLDWSFRLIETNKEDDHTIEVLSMTELVKQNQLQSIDFLKIDIEGGEVSVFGKDTDVNWLKIVKVIALEIHDEFNCREEIENLLIREGFDLSHSGELTIGVNRTLVG